MSRYSGKLKPVIDGAFILPLVLPPTVVGFGLLLLMGKHGWIGQFLALFNTTVVFSWPATVIIRCGDGFSADVYDRPRRF